MEIKKVLNKLIAVIIAVFMCSIICVSVTGMHHNIEWYKELTVLVLFMAAIYVAGLVMFKLNKFFEKNERVVFPLLVFLFFISIYVISALNKNILMYDYKDVYESAYAYAYGGTVNWSYFSYWSNNFPVFLILASLMKVCCLFSVSDPFMFILFVNCILTVWGGVCVYLIVRKTIGKVGFGVFSFLLYAAFLPLWGGTNYFYTDSLSISFGIWALYVLIKNREKLINYLFAGILCGFGYGLKPTVAICVIAVLMAVWLLNTENSKRFLKSLLLVLGLVLMVLLWNGIRRGYPSFQYENENSSPFLYWIALGIHNDGSYPGNIDFAVNLLQTTGKDAKNELAKAYISEHAGEAFSINHLILKTRYNFGSGKMGLSEFNEGTGTLMHELVNDYGKYGGFATMFSSAYLYALLIYGCIGFLIMIFSKEENREYHSILYVAQCTVFGLFLFLMIWESNNRQLYNHIPWYALCGSLGLFVLIQRISLLSKSGERGNE